MSAKYLIDANLPRYFSLWASADYQFVADIDPCWKDSQIWSHAKENSLTIVTKDADFSDRVLVEPDMVSVIHIRTGNMKMRDFHKFLTRIWGEACDLSQNHQLVQIYLDRIETIS